MKEWIAVGYEVFALRGLPGLKVEALAAKVGISKSSFYHHFADVPVFVEALLKTHLEQAARIAASERAARSIDPDLINILVAHKTDLLFNRQLRIHQDNPVFRDTLQKANQIIGTDFIALWSAHTQAQLTPRQWEGLFSLALENFFLQINSENLNRAWLTDYFRRLSAIVRSFG
jgi:AcrR family transcriptional regulator